MFVARLHRRRLPVGWRRRGGGGRWWDRLGRDGVRRRCRGSERRDHM